MLKREFYTKSDEEYISKLVGKKSTQQHSNIM